MIVPLTFSSIAPLFLEESPLILEGAPVISEGALLILEAASIIVPLILEEDPPIGRLIRGSFCNKSCNI